MSTERMVWTNVEREEVTCRLLEELLARLRVAA